MITTVHVEVDEIVKAKVEAALAGSGLTIPDAISLALLWLALEGTVPTEVWRALKKFPQFRWLFMGAGLEPNAETIEALKAARRGEGVTFDSIDELFADLNAED
jgi:DNA-damage-inducible protein J